MIDSTEVLERERERERYYRERVTRYSVTIEMEGGEVLD